MIIWYTSVIMVLSQLRCTSLVISHDFLLTAISVLPAIAAAHIAIIFIERNNYALLRLIIGGALLGASVSLMHYMGMQAMLGNFSLVYEPFSFLLSVIIAMVLAMFALNVGKLNNQEGKQHNYQVIYAAALMAAAIAAIHYTGMQPAHFLKNDIRIYN